MRSTERAEHDEGDDLTEAGQAGVDVFDLALVGRASVADDDARDEDGQKPGSVREDRGGER